MGKANASIGGGLPEDPVQRPSWKGHQQHVFGHVPSTFRQILRIRARAQRYETQHNNIAPEKLIEKKWELQTQHNNIAQMSLSATNPWQKWEPRDKPDWKKEQNEQAPQPYQHLHPHKQWKVISLQALVSLASNCSLLPIQAQLFLCLSILWKLAANRLLCHKVVQKHVD